jgi:hypothetical protein
MVLDAHCVQVLHPSHEDLRHGLYSMQCRDLGMLGKCCLVKLVHVSSLSASGKMQGHPV